MFGSPASAQVSRCGGDCSGDGQVTVDELLKLVNITLSALPLSACQSGDRNRDGAVTIGEILAAVNSALANCQPLVSLGTAGGSPRQTVDVPINLAGNGLAVVGIATLVFEFNSDVLSFVGCMSSVPGKNAEATSSAGRVAVALSGGLDPLPDGTVLDCTLEIRADAPAGSYLLHISSVTLLDGDLNLVAAGLADGLLTVLGPTQTFTPSDTPATTATPTLTVPSDTPTPTCTPTVSPSPLVPPTTTPTATPLGGIDATMGGARVPILTMQSIDILDFGYIAAQPANASARLFHLAGPSRGGIAAGDESGGAAQSDAPLETHCDTGGANVTPCTVSRNENGDESSTLTVTYSDCQTVTPSGHTIKRNGTATQTVAGASFCSTNVIPPDAATALMLSNYIFTESDATGTLLARITSTIGDTFAPTGGGCVPSNGPPLINGIERIDGMQTVVCEPAAKSLTCPAPSTNLTVIATALMLQRTASALSTPMPSGTPTPSAGGLCKLDITARGTFEVNNQALGERLKLTFDQTQLRESPDATGAMGFALNGLLHTDCLGDATFSTFRDIIMESGAKCPSGGVFDVSVVNAGTPPLEAEVRKAAESSHFARAVTLDAAQTTDNDGFRQTVFRATDGTVYQILQNVNANQLLGAEDFQVTTLVGSQVEAEDCSLSGAFDAFAVSASRFAFDPGRVVKSTRIADATGSPPCINPQGNDGAGGVCIGPDCSSTCTCPSGGTCTAFTKAVGTSLATATDLPAASLATLSLSTLGQVCSGFAGGKTYTFGTGVPTTEAKNCDPVPADGFALLNGKAVIFAYDVPLGTSFSLGYGGFPIDRNGQNLSHCLANTVLTGRSNHELIPAPSVQYTGSGGVDFDFNQDNIVDLQVATCEAATLLLCSPAPTPIPNATCPGPQNDLGNSVPPITRSGTTAGQPNGLGGASCGGGGNEAREVAFAYTAPSTGFFAIDTQGSAFDTVLYVRDGSCTGDELACNDDVSPDTVASQMEIFLRAGQRIIIVVDGFGNASGSFMLHINTAGAAPTPTAVLQLPDLTVSTVTGPTTATVGGQIFVSATVKNQGAAAAGPFNLDFVFSTDAIIDPQDVGTTGVRLPCQAFPGLLAGASGVCSGLISVPALLAPGTYFLGAFADLANQVSESDKDNNGRAADPGPIVIGGACATNTVLNFDDASAGDATSYLRNFGINLSEVTAGTKVSIVDFSQSTAASPSSPPNVLVQTDTQGNPATFTLNFSAPLDSVAFTRPMLLVSSPSGIIHPLWSAHAFNALTQEVSTVSEGLIASFTNVPAQTFTLSGPGITAVRIDSNNEHIAAFTAVLIDDLTLSSGCASSTPMRTLASTPTASVTPTIP